MKSRFIIIGVCLFVPIVLWAEAVRSKYVGEETREIKSLSADDIAELESGGGWGLAKAAELNGVPGPGHILEMQDEIKLSERQKAKVQQLYETMNAEARVLGKELIRLEATLDDSFVKRTITQESLEQLVTDIEKVRGQLRITHLATHLETPKILSSQQIILYNQLRGYNEDPCENIPKGHSAALWKKHNNCD